MTLDELADAVRRVLDYGGKPARLVFYNKADSKWLHKANFIATGNGLCELTTVNVAGCRLAIEYNKHVEPGHCYLIEANDPAPGYSVAEEFRALLEYAEELRSYARDWDWKYGDEWDEQYARAKAALERLESEGEDG